MIPQKPRVAHFIRKNSQLKSSFIRNQIAYHCNYDPLIIWRREENGIAHPGFATFDFQYHAAIDLSQEESYFEKLLYKGPKILSKRQQHIVQKHIEDTSVDICHFHYGTDCGVFYPLLQKIKMASVVSFYGYDCSSFPNILYGYGKFYLKKRVFKNVQAILAMSPDMQRDLLNIGCPAEKIIIHYHGIDTHLFYFKRKYLPKPTINLLMLCSLVPQKGHLFLLQSLVKLNKLGVRNWTLQIIGNGELLTSLQTFVATHQLSEQVTFVGAVGYASPAMMQAYHNADIFIHPSVIAVNGDKEGIPGTIVEAMSTGLPVIATYHAGIPYIIESGKTGLLVKEWDVEALAQAIRLLLTEPALRAQLGQAGQAHAHARLDIRQKEQELEAIYTQLIENYKK